MPVSSTATVTPRPLAAACARGRPMAAPAHCAAYAWALPMVQTLFLTDSGLPRRRLGSATSTPGSAVSAADTVATSAPTGAFSR